MRLEDELKAHGCDLSPDAFQERLADLFAETNPGSTVEDMLCNWQRARDFCVLVRRMVNIRNTGDELVLHTLLNMRKKSTGRLNLYERTTCNPTV